MSKSVQLSQESKQSLQELKTSGPLQGFQVKKLSGFFHTLDKITSGLQQRDSIQAEATNYARSVFFAQDQIHDAQTSLDQVLEESGIDLGERKSILSRLKPPPATTDDIDTAEEAEKVAENTATSQLLETVLAGLKQHSSNFQMVSSIAYGLTSENKGEEMTEQAQVLITQIFDRAMQDLERAKQSGELNSEKEARTFVTRRVQNTINALNQSADSPIKITTADLKQFSQNMDTLLKKVGEGLSEPSNKDDLMKFLAENKVWIFGLVAMLSQPLAKAFAGLPFGIGTPFNFILAQVNQNIGPIVTAAITGSVMKGSSGAKAPLAA